MISSAELDRLIAAAGSTWGLKTGPAGMCDKLTNEAAIVRSNSQMFAHRYAERLIGSIRRECLDHVIVFGERHLRHVLRSYAHYYNGVRAHPCRWPRTCRKRDPSRLSGAFSRCRSSADCTIITSGTDLRQAHARSGDERRVLELFQSAQVNSPGPLPVEEFARRGGNRASTN